MRSIKIQKSDFVLGTEYERLRNSLECPPGAIVGFAGLVRDHMQGNITTALTLEHYPGMTESSVEKIVDQAFERWSLQAVRVIHRIGRLSPGDQIVLVLVAGVHRQESFQACEFIMDYLKTDAVIWKKEHGEGSEKWLTPKSSDQERVKHWTE